MRLFLTGATGFVGLNLLLRALRGGHYREITVSVRDPDKLDRQLVAEGFSRRPAELRITRWGESPPAEVDHAVHCAGVLFARNRDEYFRVNVEETLAVLTRLPATARLIVLSSQSAGGPTPAGKFARTAADADSPITWYGESKLAMERRLLTGRPGTFLWRPPMILGPRDRATLPLFQMAAGPLRIKPGLRAKTFSWIAVGDLVRVMLGALNAGEWAPASPLAVCAPDEITDGQLIRAAAETLGRAGRTLPLPHGVIRGVSAVVDAVPAFRAAAPSLTRDRVREMFADRWVMDGAVFRETLAAGPFASLEETLRETRDWYVRAGMLRAA
jgi:nucleoside-diphosphate-sugar epimerase